MSAGRPTKYGADMQDKADRYLDEYQEFGDAIPSAVGLAIFIGVNKSTLYEWAKIHPALSDTLMAVNTAQERSAMNNGITGVFNSMITKLVLANHGYSDKQAIDLSSADGSMTPSRIEIVAASDDNG